MCPLHPLCIFIQLVDPVCITCVVTYHTCFCIKCYAKVIITYVAGILRPQSSSTGFGSALNIETLVAAAEKRGTPIEVLYIAFNLCSWIN